MQFDLKKSNKVVFFSDVHIGADDFREDNFLYAINKIKKEKLYCSLGGDIVENSIIEGKAAGEKLLAQATSPTEQMLYAMDKLGPLAKNGQILWALQGNHEARTRREALLDISAILAGHLGVPYLGIGGMIQIKAGKQTYVGAVQHGARSIKNRWQELDNMVSMYPDADFVTLGHDHNLDARYIAKFVFDGDNQKKHRKILQVRTGTYLGYADYARNMLYPPSFTGSPILTFEKNEHRVVADVQTLCWL